MLEKLGLKKEEQYTTYNTFGLAIISRNTITVSVNAHMTRSEKRVQKRRIEKEMEPGDEIKMLDRPIAIPFGAWVDADEVTLTTGSLDHYDEEVYQINKDKIDTLIKSALELFKGHIK